MNFPKFGLLDEPSWVSSLELLREEEHVIVAPAWEEDLSRVELVQCTSHAPHVQAAIVGQAEYDLWCSIEPRDEVRGDIPASVGLGRSRTQIADLEDRLAGVHEDVVRLDVGVHDSKLPEKLHSQQDLVRIRAHGAQVDTDILAEPLDDFAQVHAAEGEDGK